MKQPCIEGSSKIFYPLHDGYSLMAFKDAVHGAMREDSINGTGDLRKEFTYYFYRLLEKKGIATHLSKETKGVLSREGIKVRQLKPVKLEIIVRNIARGHWVDAHKIPLFNGGEVFDPPIVEFCLKMKKTLEDGRVLDDPRITPPLAVALHRSAKDPDIRGRLLFSVDEAEQLTHMALSINSTYRTFLAREGWILEDFKFEAGIDPELSSRQFILIDEISPDSSRIRDQQRNSLTKDLFRQKKSHEEIRKGYLKLRDAVKKEVEHA